MPRQNRVSPLGEILATPERGTLMGNRGVLHDAGGRIRRAWHLTRWIACVLAFKGRKRQVMTPGHYTELFFLDEATALAAGHRPCAECRRERFNAFRAAWRSAHPETSGSPPSAGEIDRRLHAERVAPDGSRVLFPEKLGELPNGVFVCRADRGEGACLVWHGGLLPWTPGGYKERLACRRTAEVLVLTPESTVAAIRAGYVPDVHPSAAALV